MKIKVTQEHIDKGRRFEPRNCPIALAAKDAGLKDVSVGAFRISFGDDLFILLPDIAYQFRSNFDTERPVEPFEFEINEN